MSEGINKSINRYNYFARGLCAWITVSVVGRQEGTGLKGEETSWEDERPEVDPKGPQNKYPDGTRHNNQALPQNSDSNTPR